MAPLAPLNPPLCIKYANMSRDSHIYTIFRTVNLNLLLCIQMLYVMCMEPLLYILICLNTTAK